jgi:hypothetical protein
MEPASPTHQETAIASGACLAEATGNCACEGGPTEPEFQDLIARFQDATVPASEFTHAAHLVVGLWHATSFDEADALPRLRAGILRLNAAHGTPNTDTRGYHETITRAYLVLLARFARANPDLRAAPLAQALLASDLAKREALFSYYSRELLMSVAARREWVEPDLRRLDA